MIVQQVKTLALHRANPVSVFNIEDLFQASAGEIPEHRNSSVPWAQLSVAQKCKGREIEMKGGEIEMKGEGGENGRGEVGRGQRGRREKIRERKGRGRNKREGKNGEGRGGKGKGGNRKEKK